MAEFERAKVNGAQLAYTTHGPADGRPVVLVHAGIADRGMFGRVLGLLPGDVRAVAYDQRGFGNSTWKPRHWSPTQDLLGLMDVIGLERATLVGSSFGGMVAMETAAYAPERVRSLVLLAPPLPGWVWSEPMQAYNAADEAALETGRFDDSIDLDLRTWVDGPRRSPEQSDPEIRREVAAALRHALEAQRRNPLGAERDLDVAFHERLDAVAVDTVVAVGELDQPDFVAIAASIVSQVPRASLHRVAGAGHLLPLERPDVVARLIAGAA